MPYNNAPISRPEEITGSSALPRKLTSVKAQRCTLIRLVARVKKIIAQDEDIAQCSNSAAFAISVATVRSLACCVSRPSELTMGQEEFIRYLAERAHDVAKSERKPRRNIAYKDIGMPFWSRT